METLESSTTSLPQPDWLRELGWAEVYEVRRLIGRGGMGRVYEGLHLQLGIPVALKIIDPGLVNEAHMRARFEKEAQTLARLQEPVPHPNIVRVIDFKLLDHVGCIVMAYVPGMDIRAWCVDGDLDMNARVALLEQVARAAGYFHSFGLIHRDLKPANILVRRGTGEPVIVDFGIVRGREDLTLTRTQQAMGTTAYMAPELLGVRHEFPKGDPATPAAQPEIHPAADVFSLGVILYELLCGEVPYGHTLAEVLPQHQKEITPSRIAEAIRRIPRDLQRICLKAIAHRPADRYANGSVLAEDLARYLRGEMVQARPVSSMRRMARRVQRRPLLCLAVGAGLMLALLAMGRLIWDLEQVRLSNLREQIGANMPVISWSTDQMLKTDRLIDQLEHHDPAQAAHYHRTLIQGAVREVMHVLKQPRISAKDRSDIEQTLAWIQNHDPKEAARLRQVVEQRQSRWDDLLVIKPPFDQAGNWFQTIPVKPQDRHLVIPRVDSRSRILKFSKPAPLEIQATLLIPVKGARSLGFKAFVNGAWHSFELHQPPPTAVVQHLQQFQHIKAPAAALEIRRKDGILVAVPLSATLQPGRQVTLKLHLEGRHMSLQIQGVGQVEYDSRYQSYESVQVALVSPDEIHLSELRWSGPVKLPARSALEKGDANASARRWAAAEEQFLQLAGDPQFGAEALFKAGDCQFEQGRLQQACETWEKVLRGPESPWRTEACLQLWYVHANEGRIDEARPYLDQLPELSAISAEHLNRLNRPGRELEDHYRSLGRGLHLLKTMPAVEDAIRVHRMLGFKQPEVSARFALSRHFNGMDEAARDMVQRAVALKKISTITPLDERTLNTNLELWSLIARSEQDPALGEVQQGWLGLAPADHSIALTISLDQARRLAREGRKEEAITQARSLLQAPQATIMTFTGAALLLAALDADPNNEAAKAALQRLDQAPRQVQELTLINRLLLHSLLKNWRTEFSVEILGQFLSLAVAGQDRENLRSRLSRLLLGAEPMVFSLNHLLEGPNGQNLLKAIALRNQPFRVSIHELFYIILRRYVVFTVFGSQSSVEQMKLAAEATRSWLNMYEIGKLTDEDFLLLLEHLPQGENCPRLKAALPTWPSSLQAAVRRLHLSR